MEKLKNENSKKIEIKIIGDNCIVSYPSSKNPSKKEVPTFPQLENEFKSTVDLNLSLSSNSEEDFISNLKEIKRRNKDNESNSKMKLEITNKSIFYSESNFKLSSSDRNIEINKNNIDYKNKESLIKNSVIKKINFDLCDAFEVLEKNKNFSESDRARNKNNLLYKNKSTNNNYIYNINNIFINNKNQINCMKKRMNSMIGNELQINKEEFNKKNLNINHSFIKHRLNEKFFLANPFNKNKIIYFNNDNNKNNALDKRNLTLNKKKSKPEIKFSSFKKKYKSPKLFNKKRNLKNNLCKLGDEKSLKAHNLKFKSTSNFSSTRKDNNNINQSLSKTNNSKNNSKCKIKEVKNSKTVNKNISNTKNNIKINDYKKNMFCIKKPNKKIVPYLTSTMVNNNLKNERKLNINKKNEYCSLKQYYHSKAPYLLNTQNISSTPITSTNGCTNGTNCTNCSTINTPSSNNTKICFKSNLDENNLLIKYHSQNSFLKNIVHNNLSHNNNHIIQNQNSKILNNNITKNKIDLNKKNINININKIIKNNSSYCYKKPDYVKYLKKSKISEINNQKLLNKCNTKELENIIKSNIKCLHKILTERNLSEIRPNSSFNSIKNNKYENNDNINY